MSPIQPFEKLIQEFKNLPKALPQPTFLELCQYPYNRMEEVSSRLLSFFMQPTLEHQFKDLLVYSLIEALKESERLNYRSDTLQVLLEENAEGKRIDLVVVGDNFVIGIENKITASLYNPLDIYYKHLRTYGKLHSIGIVLSVWKVEKANELAQMKEAGFENLLYADLFTQVKKNIGHYLGQCSNKHLIFLQDFMSTIENMANNPLLNDPLAHFFFDNLQTVNQLLPLYERFTSRVSQIQQQNVSLLAEEINTRTRNSPWTIYKQWDLMCDFYLQNHRLGIESSYEAMNRSALGQYRIYVTTWNRQDWLFYQEKTDIQKKLNIDKLEIHSDGRAYLTFAELENPTHEEIVLKLVEVYNLVQQNIILPFSCPKATD